MRYADACNADEVIAFGVHPRACWVVADAASIEVLDLRRIAAIISAPRRIVVVVLALTGLAAAGLGAIWEAAIGAAPAHRGGIGDPARTWEITSGRFEPTNDGFERQLSEDFWRAQRGGSKGGSNDGPGHPFATWTAQRATHLAPSGVTRIPARPSETENRASISKAHSEARPPVKKAAAIKKTEDDEESPWISGESRGTYRTLCVRLCDGYYWPISFATSKDKLGRDAKVCERTCGSPARLYFHENPGQNPEDMEDARGKRYADLKVAFQYRRTYDEACTCKAHPWENASLSRHQRFAELADRRKKGNKGPESGLLVGQGKMAPRVDTPVPALITANLPDKATVGPIPLDPIPLAPEPLTGDRRRAATDDTSGQPSIPLQPPGLLALGELHHQSLIAGILRRHLTAMPAALQAAFERHQTPLDSVRGRRQQSRPAGLDPAPSAARPSSTRTVGQNAGLDPARRVPAGVLAARPPASLMAETSVSHLR